MRLRYFITAVAVLALLALFGGRAEPQSAFNPYSECTFDGQFLGVRTAQTPPWRCLDTGIPYGAQVGIFQADGSNDLGKDTNSSGTYGDAMCTCSGGGGSGFGVVNASSTEPVFIKADTGTSSGVCIQSCSTIYYFGKSVSHAGYVIISSTSNARFWAGLSTTDFGTMAGSSNPAGDYAALRYASATDTNWQFITKDNSTQTVCDTGVAAGTSGFFYQMVETPSTNWKLYINGVLKCTNTTHLPRSGQLARHGISGQDTSSALSKYIALSWLETRTQ